MKIFISYAKEDSEIATRLYNDLKKSGLIPWIDVIDLKPGQTTELAINKAIKESNYVLLLLSRHSISNRGSIQQEQKRILKVFEEFPLDQIFIIPVRLDNCEPIDERLQNLHSVDIFPSYEDGFNQILRSIGSGSPIPPKMPKQKPHGYEQKNEKPADRYYRYNHIGTWVFGSLLLVFLLLLFRFGPEELPLYKHRILAIISALLSGLFSAFLTGEVSLRLRISASATSGLLISQASGGIAIFMIVLWWWTTPMAPVRQKIEESVMTGKVYFVENDKIIEPVNGATVQISKYPQYSDFTDENGIFNLKISEDIELKEIELEVIYKKYSKKVKPSVFKNIVIKIPKSGCERNKTSIIGNLMWQTSKVGIMTWDQANEYVKRKNKENFMGYGDWRLPREGELKELADLKPDVFCDTDQWYWSGSENMTMFAYIVNGGYAAAREENKSYDSKKRTYSVRLVRDLN